MHETKLHGVEFTLRVSCLHSHVLDLENLGFQVDGDNDHTPFRNVFNTTTLYNLKLLKYSSAADSLSSMCKVLDSNHSTKQGLK